MGPVLVGPDTRKRQLPRTYRTGCGWWTRQDHLRAAVRARDIQLIRLEVLPGLIDAHCQPDSGASQGVD